MNHVRTSFSTGLPSRPGRQPVRANLSSRSPVRPPKSSASARWSRDSRCTVRYAAPRATRYVWFAVDSQTTKRGGSMEHWEAKPTRQPARAPSAAAVTTYTGPSSTSVKASSPATAPPPWAGGFRPLVRGYPARLPATGPDALAVLLAVLWAASEQQCGEPGRAARRLRETVRARDEA